MCEGNLVNWKEEVSGDAFSDARFENTDEQCIVWCDSILKVMFLVLKQNLLYAQIRVSSHPYMCEHSAHYQCFKCTTFVWKVTSNCSCQVSIVERYFLELWWLLIIESKYKYLKNGRFSAWLNVPPLSTAGKWWSPAVNDGLWLLNQLYMAGDGQNSLFGFRAPWVLRDMCSPKRWKCTTWICHSFFYLFF